MYTEACARRVPAMTDYPAVDCYVGTNSKHTRSISIRVSSTMFPARIACCINTVKAKAKWTGQRQKLKRSSWRRQGGVKTPSAKPYRHRNPYLGRGHSSLDRLVQLNQHRSTCIQHSKAAAMSDIAVSQRVSPPDISDSSIPGAQLQVIRQAADPSVVHDISSTLCKPINSKFDFRVACVALDDIVSHLPLATMELYRPALETLASAGSAPSPEGVSVPCLADRARDALKFIDNPHLAWAPQHKNDRMADRSLAERVHTAEQMEPYVDELLGWLADPNWPPYPGCQKQLARFPEVTIDPIKEVILKNRNDPEWLLYILDFVEGHVPVGTLWKRIEPELIQLANGEVEDEEGVVELPKSAQRMLRLLKEAGETDAS
ncbi:uncharacterized protein TrAtP1_012635 [Trichoderma atroviride]|uniref:uncharacterized protein n=1 Tax=Hypocrea atroviridis TaxID=63577 RepID=UPI003323C1E5|nr:hypothetical protein TrAtP1_012635 [Trichoderma atroviride]